MMRSAVAQALLVGISTGCTPAISGYSAVPAAMQPRADPLPTAKAAVLAEVYGHLLASVRSCPALKPSGWLLRDQAVSNAAIGRSAEEARRIKSALEHALYRNAALRQDRAPRDECAKMERLLAATRANENGYTSALAGIW